MTPRSTKVHIPRSQTRSQPCDRLPRPGFDHRTSTGHEFEPAPVFDLGRPELRRWLTAAIATLTLGLTGLTLWQANQPPITSLLLVDGSASAQDYPLMQQLCQLRNSQLRHGDWRSTIVFADRAAVIDSAEHQGLAGMLSSCQLPDLAESRDHWEIGLTEGTSPLRALTLATMHLETLHINAIVHPSVVVIALHKAEPGPDFVDHPADLAQAIGALTRAGAIVRIIGPTGHLAEALKQSLRQTPGAQVCPATASSASACVQEAFRQARQRSAGD